MNKVKVKNGVSFSRSGSIKRWRIVGGRADEATAPAAYEIAAGNAAYRPQVDSGFNLKPERPGRTRMRNATKCVKRTVHSEIARFLKETA